MTEAYFRAELKKGVEEAQQILGRDLTEAEQALFDLAFVKGAQAIGEANANNISDSNRSIPKH